MKKAANALKWAVDGWRGEYRYSRTRDEEHRKFNNGSIFAVRRANQEPAPENVR